VGTTAEGRDASGLDREALSLGFVKYLLKKCFVNK